MKTTSVCCVLAVLLLTGYSSGNAQIVPGKLSFALPAHLGSMSIDQGNWKITELSAKENGTEFGIRAEDEDNEFLGFLYPSTKGEGNAEGCREGMLKTEGIDRSEDTTDRAVMKSDSGVEIATVLIYSRVKTKLNDHVAGTAVKNLRTRARFRAFVGSRELCGDIVPRFCAFITRTSESRDRDFSI